MEPFKAVVALANAGMYFAILFSAPIPMSLLMWWAGCNLAAGAAFAAYAVGRTERTKRP